LYNPSTTFLLYFSSILIELIDPQFQDTFSYSILGLLATTDSVENTHRSIPTARLGHIENTATQPFYSSQGMEDQLVAIDAKKRI
jgi:hypothetical protein